MIRAILVDDELAAIKSLEILIREYCPEISVVGTARSADEALSLVSKIGPDLVFLDVEMPPKTGFDFLSQCQNIDFEVIFVTAYNHYAVKAFKHSAVDYILKPIDIDELKESIKKLKGILNSKTSSQKRYSILFDNLKEIIPRKLVLLTTEGFKYFDTQSIAAIVIHDNLITFNLNDKSTFQYQLANFDILSVLDDKGFLYIHEYTYINISLVSRIDRAANGKVVLTNGQSYPITEISKDEILERIQHFK